MGIPKPVAHQRPERLGEVAVSDRAVEGVSIGDKIVLGGVEVAVVGIVENPTDLVDFAGMARAWRCDTQSLGPRNIALRFGLSGITSDIHQAHTYA